MKIAEQIDANRWLFAGLSALPAGLQGALLICLFTLGNRGRSADLAVPEWMIWGAFSFLPVLVAIVGFVIAYSLSVESNWLRWTKQSVLSKVYTVFFVAIWNAVYGFLGLFVFAMGFGDGPEPTSIQQFGERFLNALLVGFPFATLISLIVCFLAAAIVVALGETILAGLRTTH